MMVEIFEIDDDLSICRQSGGFQYEVRGCVRREVLIDQGRFCFGIVVSGSLTINGSVCGANEFVAGAGTYFSLVGGSLSPQQDCSALVVLGGGNSPLAMIGGPVERVGRLRYVDGCSDTLLIPPSRLGEPCLNLLHMPVGTNQRMHFHPSDRVGVILRGQGECITDQWMKPLRAGQGWLIPEMTNHCFRTDTSPMDVIAWHPDSDYGPTDENHPMINRTWIRAKS